MAPGMDAVRCRHRCWWIVGWIGLTVGITNLGCAQLRSEGPLHERFGRSKPGRGPSEPKDWSTHAHAEETGQPEPWVAQPQSPRTEPTNAPPSGPYGPADREAAALLRTGTDLASGRQDLSQPQQLPEEDPAPTPDEYQIMESLINAGQNQLAKMPTYQVQLTRQERVGQVLQPLEKVTLSIRRQPRAVRIEWLEGPNQGREVLYSPGDSDGQMYIKMVNQGLVPPLRMAPDSPLALRNSRHPINEAGFETIFANLQANLHSVREGEPNAGTLAYEGQETPEAVGRLCHKIVRITPTGETYRLYLDQETGLPALVHATIGGQLLEYYQFRDIQSDLPELAQADAFDPSVRFPTTSNMLGRLVRAAGDVSANQPESLSP